MGKILLMLAAMSVLILSARLTYIRPEPSLAVHSPSVNAAIGNLSRGLEGVSGISSPQATEALLPGAERSDRPAAALLVYLAVILVGSVFGIAMTRRIPREL
jgi:hypothetical protein